MKLTVKTYVSHELIDTEQIKDPFIVHSVRLSLWDCIKAFFWEGNLEVKIVVEGDKETVFNIMNCDKVIDASHKESTDFRRY